MRVSDLNLKPEILKSLKRIGYDDLTPIQAETIQPILDGKDIMALAETGSGKTGACGIPIAEMIDPNLRDIQALILVPTRELAQQYVDEVYRISEDLNLSHFAIFGGFSMDMQKAKLNDGVHILVATPGRLIDHLYNGDLSLKNLKTLVLDEADEMLNMGFFDDVRFIISCIVNEHQTLMFSATMADEIAKLAKECLKDPLRIELNKDVKAPQSLGHYFSVIQHHRRVEKTVEYLSKEDVGQAIIFVNTRNSGERLLIDLKKKLSSIEYIHGGLVQEKRTRIFNRFKSRNIKFLLATDVAGRGLDFRHVTHVVNHDFPTAVENYTHRTGRAGRMGNKGTAISWVTGRDLGSLRELLKANKIEANWIGPPPGENDERGGDRKKRGDRGRNFRRGGKGRGPRRPRKPKSE